MLIKEDNRKNRRRWYVHKEKPWQQFLFVWCLPLVATLFGSLGGYLIKSDLNNALAYGIGVSATAALITIYLQHRRQQRAERNLHIQRQTLTRYTDNLKSIHDPLIRLHKSPKTFSDGEQFLSALALSAGHLFAYDGLRVCIYELDAWYSSSDINEDDESTNELKILRLIAFGGRNDFPRYQFTDENEHGRFAIKTAESHVSVPINGDQTEESDIDRSPSSVWNSFMIFPIRTINKSLGILTIDSREDIQWTAQDHAIGSTISALATEGVLVVKNSSRDPIPETKQLLQTLQALDDPSVLYNPVQHTTPQGQEGSE